MLFEMPSARLSPSSSQSGSASRQSISGHKQQAADDALSTINAIQQLDNPMLGPAHAAICKQHARVLELCSHPRAESTAVCQVDPGTQQLLRQLQEDQAMLLRKMEEQSLQLHALQSSPVRCAATSSPAYEMHRCGHLAYSTFGGVQPMTYVNGKVQYSAAAWQVHVRLLFGALHCKEMWKEMSQAVA